MKDSTVAAAQLIAKAPMDGEVFKTLLNVEEMLKAFVGCHENFTDDQQILLWDAVKKNAKLAKKFIGETRTFSPHVVEHILSTERRSALLEVLVLNNPLGEGETKNVKKSFPRFDRKLQGRLLIDGSFSREESLELLGCTNADEKLVWFLCEGFKGFSDSESLKFIESLFVEDSIFIDGQEIINYLASEHVNLVKELIKSGVAVGRNLRLLQVAILSTSNIRFYNAEDFKSFLESELFVFEALDRLLADNFYFNYVKYRPQVTDEHVPELIHENLSMGAESWRSCTHLTRESMKFDSSWHSSMKFKDEASSNYFVEYLPAYQEILAGKVRKFSEQDKEDRERENALRQALFVGSQTPTIDPSQYPLRNMAYAVGVGEFILQEMKDADLANRLTFFKILPISGEELSVTDFLKTVKALR